MDNIKEVVAFYDQRYESIDSCILEPGKKITLGNKNKDQPCRFCGKRAPEVKFRRIAHVLPEAIGNKSLFSTYECDTCNQLFGDGIETEFGKWSKPMRTFTRIRGKSSVPALKREGAGGWRVEYADSNFTITLQEGAQLIELNEKENTAIFTLPRDVYTPIAVFKAFVKMGLSLMPESEMSNFKPTLEWIRNPNHQINFIVEGSFPAFRSFIPGPMRNDRIALFIYRRKAGIEDVPYSFLVLGYGNEVFQVFLPSPERDKALDGKKVEFIPFPNPRNFFPSEFGPPKTELLDLTGRSPIKGDSFPLQMKFEKIT